MLAPIRPEAPRHAGSVCRILRVLIFRGVKTQIIKTRSERSGVLSESDCDFDLAGEEILQEAQQALERSSRRGNETSYNNNLTGFGLEIHVFRFVRAHAPLVGLGVTLATLLSKERRQADVQAPQCDLEPPRLRQDFAPSMSPFWEWQFSWNL